MQPENAYITLAPTEQTRFVLMPGGEESDYTTWKSLDEIFVQQFPASRQDATMTWSPSSVRHYETVWRLILTQQCETQRWQSLRPR